MIFHIEKTCFRNQGVLPKADELFVIIFSKICTGIERAFKISFNVGKVVIFNLILSSVSVTHLYNSIIKNEKLPYEFTVKMDTETK